MSLTPDSATPSSGDPGAPRGTALFGWSPPPLPSDSRVNRRFERLFPATGLPLAICLGTVVALLVVAPLLRTRAELGMDGLAFLAGGGWCAFNFWRCRHAHCVVTGGGWLALSVLTLAEVGVGHSLIHGDEQPAFVAVLVAGLLFELAWSRIHGSNAVKSG